MKLALDGKTKLIKSLVISEGCTYVRELLVSLAIVAFQTIYGEKSRQTTEASSKNKPNPFQGNNGIPALLNTCFAFDERSEVTEKQWPNYFKKD